MKISVIVRDERFLDQCLENLISRTSPDYIVEVGSYDGSTLRRFSEASPYSKPVGFEANPKNFFNLCVGKNIQHMAVSNAVGKIRFYQQIPEDSNARQTGRILEKTGSIFKISGVNKFNEYIVPCTTLDQFFEYEIDRKRTFVLIIDAEGATKQILEGAQRLLKTTIAIKVELECVEFFEGQSLEEESFALLKDKLLVGEQLTKLENGEKMKQTNYYFVSDFQKSRQFKTY